MKRYLSYLRHGLIVAALGLVWYGYAEGYATVNGLHPTPAAYVGYLLAGVWAVNEWLTRRTP